MKKLLTLLLCLCLCLAAPVRAEERGYLALTFDDGPSGRFTRRLLDGLRDRQVRATFFLCGYRMDQYPELAARIAEEGHEIGLHGYSHGCMGAMDADCLARELDRTAELVQRLTGSRSVLLRPPGGAFGSAVTRAAAERGLGVVTWSVDPRDWATDDRRAVVQNVSENIRDGSVILLHDMSDSSVDAALELADRLGAQGWRFVTVSELFELRELKMVPGTVYSALYPKE